MFTLLIIACILGYLSCGILILIASGWLGFSIDHDKASEQGLGVIIFLFWPLFALFLLAVALDRFGSWVNLKALRSKKQEIS